MNYPMQNTRTYPIRNTMAYIRKQAGMSDMYAKGQFLAGQAAAHLPAARVGAMAGGSVIGGLATAGLAQLVAKHLLKKKLSTGALVGAGLVGVGLGGAAGYGLHRRFGAPATVGELFDNIQGGRYEWKDGDNPGKTVKQYERLLNHMNKAYNRASEGTMAVARSGNLTPMGLGYARELYGWN